MCELFYNSPSLARTRGNYKGNTMDGKRLTEALEALEWRQSDFCAATGVHRNTISGWCRGEAPVPRWVESYLGLLLHVKTLAEAILKPPKQDIQQN